MRHLSAHNLITHRMIWYRLQKWHAGLGSQYSPRDWLSAVKTPRPIGRGVWRKKLRPEGQIENQAQHTMIKTYYSTFTQQKTPNIYSHLVNRHQTTVWQFQFSAMLKAVLYLPPVKHWLQKPGYITLNIFKGNIWNMANYTRLSSLLSSYTYHKHNFNSVNATLIT